MVGIGVLAISPDALIIRLVDMQPLAIAFWRGLLMAVGFLGVALVLYRGDTVNRFRSMGRVGLAVAAFSACSGILFVTAITHTSVSDTLVILATSPVFAAVLSSLFLGDRISRGDMGRLAADPGRGGRDRAQRPRRLEPLRAILPRSPRP